jgi:hypothetical protein
MRRSCASSCSGSGTSGRIFLESLRGVYYTPEALPQLWGDRYPPPSSKERTHRQRKLFSF